METSELLPTPSARDWHGAGKKPRDTLDSLIENGATKRRSGMFNSCRGVFPANRSATPDEDEVRQMTVGSGLQCLALYNKHTQHGLSQRMFMASLLGGRVWYSSRCALTWRVKTMTSNRLLFRLVPSTRPTGGTESGLLRTPLVHQPGIPAERLVTKDGQPYRIGHTAYDRQTDRKVQVGLSQQLGSVTGGTLRLQPAFCLWMMGLPETYLDFPMEAPSAKPNGGGKR